jgi:hypothetical protein
MRATVVRVENAITQPPKCLEPSGDFRPGQDQVGVDDVLPIQFPVVRLGEDEVGGNRRYRDYARSRSMPIKRNQEPGHGCPKHNRNLEYIVALRLLANWRPGRRVGNLGFRQGIFALGARTLACAGGLGGEGRLTTPKGRHAQMGG